MAVRYEPKNRRPRRATNPFRRWTKPGERRFRVGMIGAGVFMALWPGVIIPLLAGPRLVETDFLELWGLMAAIGTLAAYLGVTAPFPSKQSARTPSTSPLSK